MQRRMELETKNVRAIPSKTEDAGSVTPECRGKWSRASKHRGLGSCILKMHRTVEQDSQCSNESSSEVQMQWVVQHSPQMQESMVQCLPQRKTVSKHRECGSGDIQNS